MRYFQFSDVLQSYVDYGATYSRFRIRKAMSMSLIGRGVDGYQALDDDLQRRELNRARVSGFHKCPQRNKPQ